MNDMKIRVPGKYHWPDASHWQTLSHNVVWSTTPCLSGVWTHNVLIAQVVVNQTTIRSWPRWPKWV